MNSIFIAIFFFQIVVAYDFLRSDDESPEEKCLIEAGQKLSEQRLPCPEAANATDEVKLATTVIDCAKRIFMDAKCGDEARWKEFCLRTISFRPAVTLSPIKPEIVKAVEEECTK